MSRKTRKLTWSAPLVAVFAVVGALAIFAAVMPDGVLAHGLPGVVANLTAEADGTRAIDLSWDAPSGDAVDSYRVDRSEGGNTWVTHVTGHQGTTYKDMDLDPGTPYYYRVFAVNSAGTGPVSQDVVRRTDFPTRPGTVRGLTARATDQNTIMLSWQPPAKDGGSDIEKYRIHIAEPGDNDANVIDALPAVTIGDTADTLTEGVMITKDTGTTATFDKLVAGNRYMFQVYAINEAGFMSAQPGDTAAVTTARLVKPGAPTGVTAVQTNTTEYTLYWYAPANTGGANISSYLIEVSLNNRSYIPSGITYTANAGNSEEATYTVPENVPDVTPVQPVTSVRFQVKSQTTDSTTDPVTMLTSESGGTTLSLTLLDDEIDHDGVATTDEVLVRTNLIPDAPTFIGEDAAVRDSFKNVDLKWTAPPTNTTPNPTQASDSAPDSIGGYRIDVSDDGMSWQPLVNYTSKADPTYNYVDTEKENRFYRIFAWHGQYLGPAQEVPVQSEFTSGTVTAPGFPGGLTATAVGPTQIDLSWTEPTVDGNAPIVEYQVHGAMQIAEGAFAIFPTTAVAADVTNQLFVTRETTSYMHTGLKAGQTWRYRVLAVNEDADGGKTPTENESQAEVREATTHQESMPDAPEMLTAEVAKDSNAEATTQRGVLLLWNAPDDPAGADIGGYRVQRMKDGGAWETLVNNTGDADTDYTDSEEPEMGEMRGYRVAAISTNDIAGAWSNTAYHPAMMHTHNTAPMAVGTIAPVTVTAGEMSDAMDVSGYFSDADMGDTLAYTAMSNMEMYATADIPAGSSMLTITGVAAGMATITVTATDAAGAYAMQTIMVTVEAADMTPTSPSNVMATADDTDPGDLMITVTWTDGENVEAYGVVLFNSDFSEWPYIARGMNGSHTFSNVDAGSYVAVVVALDADGTLLTDANGDYLFGPANAVTIGQ